MSRSSLEDQFYALWLSKGGPPLERQARISALVPTYPRRHTIDFHSKAYGLTIEIQGGTFQRKRTAHATGPGLRRDYTKSLICQAAGYRHIMLDNKQALDPSLVGEVISHFCRVVVREFSAEVPLSFATSASNMI